MGENLPREIPSALRAERAQYLEAEKRVAECGGRGGEDDYAFRVAEVQAQTTLAKVCKRAEETLGNAPSVPREWLEIGVDNGRPIYGDVSRMFGGIDYSLGYDKGAPGGDYTAVAWGDDGKVAVSVNNAMQSVMKERTRNLLGIKDEPKPTPKKPAATPNLRPQRLVQVNDEEIL